MFFSMFIIPIVVFTGIYFSCKLNFIHFTGLLKVFRLFFVNKASTGTKNISSFTALSTILGGNLGTGNISGVAVAMATGGPGTLFWMFVVILIISVLKYISCILGIKYRMKDMYDNYHGGPMYYMKYGLCSPVLATFFAFALLISAFTVGNLVQVNSLVLPLHNSAWPPIFYGIAIAVIVFVVTIGGVKWFAETITKVVPAMSLIYLGSCFYILVTHYESIIPSFSLIFTSAFDASSVSGGVFGYGVLHILSIVKVGFIRGVFATDIGLGLESIVHSNVYNNGNQADFARGQATLSVLSPFVVMLVCLITGLVLLVTGVWNNSGLESTNMCFAAFNVGIPYANLASYVLLIVLFCFAFTTILTWLFCANQAIEYLASGRRYIMYVWQAAFILLLPVGAVAKVGFLWSLADVAIALMLILNLYAMIALSGEVIDDRSTRNSKIVTKA